VAHAFIGIRAVVAALIINAVVKFFKSGVKDLTGVVIFIAAFAVAGILGVSSVYVVIGALIVGLIAGQLRRRIKK
ncbi:MAG: chromate transporter, partial [Monoglobus pectinilyticus]